MGPLNLSPNTSDSDTKQTPQARTRLSPALTSLRQRPSSYPLKSEGWTSLRSVEYWAIYRRPGPEDNYEAIRQLTLEGMTTRQTADKVGVVQATVSQRLGPGPSTPIVQWPCQTHTNVLVNQVLARGPDKPSLRVRHRPRPPNSIWLGRHVNRRSTLRIRHHLAHDEEVTGNSLGTLSLMSDGLC